MLRMLEDIHTKSHGINNWIATKIALFIFVIACYPTQGLWGQFYYVNTYENPHGPNSEQLLADVFVKSIDLSTRSVTDSIQLHNRGYLLSKKPATITFGNQVYLITMNEIGGPGRNSSPSDPQKVFYTILQSQNGDLTLVREDSIENADVEIFRQYPGEEGFRFGLSSFPAGNVIFQIGLYGLSQGNNFRYLRNVNIGEEPGLLRNVIPYDYVIKVPNDTVHNLYYTLYNFGEWVVKVNSNRTTAIDSLQLRSSGLGNALYAYHPGQSKFYCLRVNYELHYNEDGDTAYKSREDRYINPEVWIINPATLAIEQQLPIADYPEGNYPGEDGGLADVLGDYIVYYFFWGTGRARFDPAMLFIFDTRTNEATWLRVGWR